MIRVIIHDKVTKWKHVLETNTTKGGTRTLIIKAKYSRSNQLIIFRLPVRLV
jgi:hypothetical protein